MSPHAPGALLPETEDKMSFRFSTPKIWDAIRAAASAHERERKDQKALIACPMVGFVGGAAVDTGLVTQKRCGQLQAGDGGFVGVGDVDKRDGWGLPGWSGSASAKGVGVELGLGPAPSERSTCFA